MAVKGLVIWAHSMCRSTFGLYREAVRQAPVPARIAFREGPLACRREQGFTAEDFGAVPSVAVGEDLRAVDALLAETAGWAHVVTSYQVSPAFRHVLAVAHARGDRTVVYSEAPCEMCLGPKAWAKRLYYRLLLPLRMKGAVRSADLFLSQSGKLGAERLRRLGWRREQIVPFGYVSAPLVSSLGAEEARTAPRKGLRILHLGSEAPYRGVAVLERAVRFARARGAEIALEKTGGKLPLADLVRVIRAADLVVACGICEPWGLRVNDALAEGRPVVVSDGMGAAWLVEETGAGLVVPKNDAGALAAALVRCATDREFLRRLASGAAEAARVWTPSARAKEFLRLALGPGEEARA